jgi:signal transduction histidine kinase
VLVGFDGDYMVATDKMRIQQVILSYQSNALKFTPLGGSIIIFATRVKQNNKTFLEVKVKDSGCGISEENQSKLFKLFGYLDDTNQMNT